VYIVGPRVLANTVGVLCDFDARGNGYQRSVGRRKEHGDLQTPESDSKSECTYEGVRGMLENGGHVGAPATLLGVRARGLLRFVKEQTCHEAFSSNEAPDHAVAGTGRKLGLVLHR
jgi:hypothetical protein